MHGADEPLRGGATSTCARSASTRRSASPTRCGPRSPYFAAFDEATHDFVLVLEDLGRLRLADQNRRVQRDGRRTVIDGIARHHAYWWDNDRLAVASMADDRSTTPPFPTVVAGNLRGGLADVRRTCRLRHVACDARLRRTTSVADAVVPGRNHPPSAHIPARRPAAGPTVLRRQRPRSRR